jgi:hypothetical protein
MLDRILTEQQIIGSPRAELGCNCKENLPTDVQENSIKKNIKIYIKTAPTCFGFITIIRERTI